MKRRWVVVLHTDAEGVSVCGDLFETEHEAKVWAQGPNALGSMRGGLDGTEVPEVWVIEVWSLKKG